MDNNPNTFSWPVRIYWEDTDAGGIVFYANYLKFFERARTELLRSYGIDQSAMREQYGGFFVVSETSVKYHAPAKLDDELSVTAAFKHQGQASMTIEQQCFRGTQLLAQGTIRIGWVDQHSFKPSRIPDVILAKFNI
jgi:acyl-CoA thioester hydrolase